MVGADRPRGSSAVGPRHTLASSLMPRHPLSDWLPVLLALALAALVVAGHVTVPW